MINSASSNKIRAKPPNSINYNIIGVEITHIFYSAQKQTVMKKSILFISILVAAIGLSSCATQKGANKDTDNFRYELECAGTGSQGSYLVKVWSYSRNPKIAAEQCKKNAVHGVIFKGYSGQNGCVAQRALASDPGVELQYKEYFKRFFSDENGEYLKYVSVTSASQEVVKVGKDYKVGIIVTVQKDALRKALEQAGVIRGLSSGF